jgi:hypothetical protein
VLPMIPGGLPLPQYKSSFWGDQIFGTRQSRNRRESTGISQPVRFGWRQAEQMSTREQSVRLGRGIECAADSVTFGAQGGPMVTLRTTLRPSIYMRRPLAGDFQRRRGPRHQPAPDRSSIWPIVFTPVRGPKWHWTVPWSRCKVLCRGARELSARTRGIVKN